MAPHEPPTDVEPDEPGAATVFPETDDAAHAQAKGSGSRTPSRGQPERRREEFLVRALDDPETKRVIADLGLDTERLHARAEERLAPISPSDEQLAEWAEDLHANVAEMRPLWERSLERVASGRWVRILLGLLAVAVLVLWLFGLFGALVAVTLIPAYLALVVVYLYWRDRVPDREQAAQELQEAAARAFAEEAQRWLERDAQQAVRAAINDLARTAFSHRVRLVDRRGLRSLTTREFDVPTRSRERLREVIRNLDSGVVGVAGPRGAGKTTLLDAVTLGRVELEDGRWAGGVLVAAPVRYEASDFIRYLFAQVCKHVLARTRLGLSYPAARRRQQLALATATSGLALIVSIIVLGSIGLGHSVGLAFVVVAPALITISLTPLIPRLIERRQRAQEPRHVQLARRYARRLRYLETLSSEFSAEVELRGVRAGGKRARDLAEQAMTLPELGDAYGELISAMADDETAPVVIGIDELDKMDSLDDARRFLNDLKTLFGRGPAYYLVSVSDDAVTAFERRGLPLRDAIESTFDDVLRVEALDLTEGTELLSRRAAPMPATASALCHVVAGGLPRELIRTGRVFAANVPNEGCPLPEITAAVVCDRYQQRVRAAAAIARGNLTADGRQPLLSWLRDAPALATPADLLKRSEVGVLLKEVDAALDRDKSAVITMLVFELATCAYQLATVWQLFAELTPQTFDQVRSDQAGVPCALDTLASVERELGNSPAEAWALASTFRRAIGMPTLAYPT
jgi:hypothetical protein